MAGMLVALVHAAASLRRVSSWPARAGNLLIAAAFAGLAWFAIEHNLIRFSLAY